MVLSYITSRTDGTIDPIKMKPIVLERQSFYRPTLKYDDQFAACTDDQTLNKNT